MESTDGQGTETNDTTNVTAKPTTPPASTVVAATSSILDVFAIGCDEDCALKPIPTHPITDPCHSRRHQRTTPSILMTDSYVDPDGNWGVDESHELNDPIPHVNITNTEMDYTVPTFLDSAASDMCVVNRKRFIRYKEMNWEGNTAQRTGGKFPIKGVGIAQFRAQDIQGNERVLVVKALHTPSLAFNLLSIPTFVLLGYKVPTLISSRVYS